MNRNLVIVILAVIAIVAWWEQAKRESAAPSVPATRASTTRASTPPATPPPAAMPTPAPRAVQTAPAPPTPPAKIIAAPPTATSGGERQKPPPNAVPFEVIGEFVVSFGDQLIGKPTVANFPPSGFIEAPKVNLWPKGEIPFSFHPAFRNPERVQRVLDYFNQNTPIRFVPLNESHKDSIVFAPGEVPLCLSYVGRIGGHQPVYLDDRCFEKEITHELMHVFGFVHEQSRPDRDQFVRVRWDKIQEDKQSQYEVVPESMAKPYRGRPFDFQSVMIYDPTDFAKVRGDVTMESLTGVKIEPAAQGISSEDLARLTELYRGT